MKAIIFVGLLTCGVAKAEVPVDPVACLANNIYYEASVESYEGKLAVAQVTINRADIGGHSVCEVVYFKRINPSTGKKEAAFSWTLGAKWRAKGMNVRVYDQCVAMARAVIENNLRSNMIDERVEFYHAKYISPYWKDRYIRVTQIGQHIFYRRRI